MAAEASRALHPLFGTPLPDVTLLADSTVWFGDTVWEREFSHQAPSNYGPCPGHLGSAMLTAVSDSGGTVTISASYGAGGSAIAPAVADALGLPFFDRAIPAAVASKLALPVREAEEKDETVDSGLVRLIGSMAVLPDLTGRTLSYRRSADTRTFKIKTEEILNEIAAGAGGVILGRAAAVVLADAPNALHVRLDGPPEARVAALVRRGRDELVAREEQRANDAARTAYVRHFYRCDPAAARHYHLVIDTTEFGWEPATDLVVAAARARGIGA